MALTVESLKEGIGRILAEIESEHEGLTELDGKLGDGDLGITLLKAFRELDQMKASLPADLGQALMQCASAVARVSSSSFGTLLATGLMAVARETKGAESVEWSNLSSYLDKAVAAMSARGKASLGDKTVLDAVAAASAAAAALNDPAEIRSKALAGVDAALDEFRGKPNKVGRARIFAERTVGLDDPGMVAFRVMLAAL